MLRVNERDKSFPLSDISLYNRVEHTEALWAKPLFNMNYSPAQSREQYFMTHVKPSQPSDDPHCPICTDAWNSDTCPVIETKCRHIFHDSCLRQWLYDEASPNTCPTCRAVCFHQPSTQATLIQPPTHHADYVSDPRLEADLDYVNNITFHMMATGIQGIVGPLMGTLEIHSQFNIDLERGNDPSRFLQAMELVISLGVALSRSPPSYLEGWMPILMSRLRDYMTIKFLVASIFITAQSSRMTPSQWASVVAQRNRIGRAASASMDFVPSTSSWVTYINDRYNVQYEILVEDYFPNATIVRWQETRTTNTASYVVNEGQHDCTVIDASSTVNINVPGTEMSPGPLLYFQGNSLWISEQVMGNIVSFSIDRTSRTVFVRSSADHEFEIEFL
jgi:hypothetical protein